MTPADILAAIRALPLEDHQRVLVECNSEYARKLMAFRKGRAMMEREVQLACDHTWGPERTSGRGGTHHERGCTKCTAKEEWDSSG